MYQTRQLSKKSVQQETEKQKTDENFFVKKKLICVANYKGDLLELESSVSVFETDYVT